MMTCAKCGTAIPPQNASEPCPKCGSLDRQIAQTDSFAISDQPLPAVNVGKGEMVVGAFEAHGSGTVTPPPSFVIVWDPEVISKSEYSDLATALGDVVRASGGLGLQRIKSRGCNVPCEVGVPQ